MKGQQVLTRKRILGISIITAIMLILSSIVVYASVIKPKKYDEYMALGNKYLMEENYEEAILAFDKAIKIDAKTTEARVGQAKAYVGNEENDKAVEVLEEAQNLDKTSEELLQEILKILKGIDSDIAYEFLDRFVGVVGKDNLSTDIKELLDSANKIPSVPIANPTPGKYVNPISVELQLDKINIGHTYYYTVDGSTPNRDSNKYSGKIEISDTTTVKLTGYNKKDESTDVVTLDYIIDKEIVGEVESKINKAEKLIKDTKVGSGVGNISEAHSEKLKQIVNDSKNLLNKKSIGYEDIYKTKNKIEDGIKVFKNNIIKPVDKSKLKSAINQAEGLYNNSTEGNSKGQYKKGSKSALMIAIDKAKKIYNDSSSKQENVNLGISSLNNAISIFKRNKITVSNKSSDGSYTREYVAKYYAKELNVDGNDTTVSAYPYEYDKFYNGEKCYVIQYYRESAHGGMGGAWTFYVGSKTLTRYETSDVGW